MANTYTQIYIHVIFAVHGRESLLQDEWWDSLFRYIIGACKNRKHYVYAINGMADHLHLLIGINPSESLSQLIQSIKLQSSKWINDKYGHGHFHWQKGYGAFSYSKSQVPIVSKYIANQQEHHKRVSFHDELISILEKAGIEYNPDYIMKGFV